MKELNKLKKWIIEKVNSIENEQYKIEEFYTEEEYYDGYNGGIRELEAVIIKKIDELIKGEEK